jgi:AcrR family transcriptional regulator
MSSAERRQTILQAAARLFEHYGHGKTTMADVAREAGVGVGSVYLEFDSKDAIVAELSSSTHVGVLDRMREAAGRDGDHARRLTAVLIARTECFLELRRRGEHACELLHCKTEGVRAAHARFRAEERAFLREILDEGQRSGVFGRIDAPRTAMLIQRAFASLSPPWIADSDADALRSAFEMSNLVLHGILPRPARAARPRRPTKPAEGGPPLSRQRPPPSTPKSSSKR